MIDHVRSYELNMCDFYTSSPPASARLDDFQVFKKGNASYTYGNYYNNYDVYSEPEMDTTANVYHTLVSSREYRHEDWKSKVMIDWTDEDTVSWMIECAVSQGFSDYEVPFYNFKVSGMDLRNMRREEFIQRMAHPHVDPTLSRKIGEIFYEKLQARLNEEIHRQSTIFRYESDPYTHQETVQSVLDLDKHRLYSSDYKPNDNSLLPASDSSDDAEDTFRTSASASPVFSYGSDSKSGDEEDKRKMSKRPPGRPKGSGKNRFKRPRSVSVPEFLRNLLIDEKHCPSIIKWEDYSQGKFRYDVYSEPESINSNAYHDLISSCQYRDEDWKSKVVAEWTAKDTVSWLIEYTVLQGFYESDVPYYNFIVSGNELRNMRREEIIQRMAHPSVDPNLSMKIAHKVYDALEDEEIHRKTSEFRFEKNDSPHQDILQSAFDEYRDRIIPDFQRTTLLPGLDSKKDLQNCISTSLPPSSTGAPKDKKDKSIKKDKLNKKPPGRPKGTGKNTIKHPRNESVPEFLWNFLKDESKRHLIVWEDYSQLKFRFIKPDEVAKLWGQMKQNDNMTFEKFSRAMRYHYRQKVLVSVPSARLVYQFGSKGPDFKTQNPNFVKVKSELDLQDLSYS